MTATSDHARIRKIGESTQIFFEEAVQALLKWRLFHVVDRPLRALLYQISRDEARHLAVGRHVLGLRPGEALEKRMSLFFPVHLIPERKELHSKAREIGAMQMKLALNQAAYRPHGILASFETLPGYYCQGCCPFRPDGFLLEPKLGEAPESVFDNFSWAKRFEGFNGMVHGGAIAAALDELMGYATILCGGALSVTTQLKLTYLRPVMISTSYRIEARILESSGKLFKVESSVVDAAGKACVTAIGDFHVLEKKIADRIIPSLSNHPTLKSLIPEA